jgi:hypothetical protein
MKVDPYGYWECHCHLQNLSLRGESVRLVAVEKAAAAGHRSLRKVLVVKLRYQQHHSMTTSQLDE